MNGIIRCLGVATVIAIQPLPAQETLRVKAAFSDHLRRINPGLPTFDKGSLCFKEDGTALAWINRKGELLTWSFPSGALIQSTLPTRNPSDHGDAASTLMGDVVLPAPTGIFPEPSPRWAVTMTEPGFPPHVRGWAMKAGCFDMPVSITIQDHSYSVQSIGGLPGAVISRDGNCLATICGKHFEPRSSGKEPSPSIPDEPRTLRFFREHSTAPLWSKEMDKASGQLWLNPDGSLLLLIHDWKLKTIETQTGGVLSSIDMHGMEAPIRMDGEVAWFAGGRRFVVGPSYATQGEATYDIVDATSLRRLRRFALPENVESPVLKSVHVLHNLFGVSPDGRYLVTGSVSSGCYIDGVLVWSLSDASEQPVKAH